MNTPALSRLTRWISSITAKVFSGGMCSQTWLRTTVWAQLSGSGHGVWVKSQTRSTPSSGRMSMPKLLGCFPPPQPTSRRMPLAESSADWVVGGTEDRGVGI